MIKLPIDNSFTSALPQDPILENYTRQVLHAGYSVATPRVFRNAQVIHTSTFAAQLGLDAAFTKTDAFKKLVTGQEIYSETTPYAMAYAGHQFGHWAGQLGDGRAINLFEILHNNQRWALQLKGAGPTPYSRQGDGFAVLRSSIREHLCSEAMHHLGVPTTRSLSLSLSGEQVLRDMLYDGNAAYEKGAIVCRVAPSFVRFGNFELFAAQGNNELLKTLADYTIKTFYSHITAINKDAYIQFFQEVTDRTLDLIMHWQRVGFVHGVMNTDNMSILGITIDYGPYGWLDDYNHGWTPNTTDSQHKRYRYGAQPEIGLWNLLQLANALYPLIEDSQPLQDILDGYKSNYLVRYLDDMQAKLGLSSIHKDDRDLIATLEDNLHLHETDMTLFYRELSKIGIDTSPKEAFDIITTAFYNSDTLTPATLEKWMVWLQAYIDRLGYDKSQSLLDYSALPAGQAGFAIARIAQMHATNPKYVLRNYIAQQVIDAANEGDYSLLHQVYDMLKNPYTDQPQYDHWYAKRPDWARDKVGCSMLSCSS